MDKKFKQIYYSDGGYWRGKSAIQKLAKASGSTKEEAEKWLLKQPLYQIYLPAPKYIPRPNASMSLFAKPNDIHQSDLLSLPHDKFKKKTYKYALNIVDVASRYKGSYQLTSSNIPSGTSYGVYISQLIRYARCCSHYDDFRYRHKCLVDRLLSKGYIALRLEKSFKKFYGRYQDLIEKYQRSVNVMVNDSFSG